MDLTPKAKGHAPSSFVSENLTKMKHFDAPDSVAHIEIIRDTAGVAFSGRLHLVSLEIGWTPDFISLLAGADTVRFHRLKSVLLLSYATKTVSVVLSTMLAFLLYPEVQAKAQAELDAVVGPTWLPNFDDRPQLPYIEAILSEALRWNPVLPMGIHFYTTNVNSAHRFVGIAHRSVQEDVYRGYYIPAGMSWIGFFSVPAYLLHRRNRRW